MASVSVARTPSFPSSPALPVPNRLASSRSIGSQVRHVPAIDPKEHLGGGMTELPGDPFGRLAGRKPQRRRGVAHLVRAPALQTQMAQKRKPDTVGEVLVVDRLAFAV